MAAGKYESLLREWVDENPEYRTLHFLESNGGHSAVISDLTWFDESPQIWPVKATEYLASREAASKELVGELKLEAPQEVKAA